MPIGRRVPAPARRTVPVVVAAAVVLTAVAVYAHRYGFDRLGLTRDGLRAWGDGVGPYAYRDPAGRALTVPPVALLAALPAALLPLQVAGWLLALAGVAALGLSLVALVGPVARRYGRARWPAVAAALALALVTEPVRAALGLGTLDLVVFGLVVADVVALRRGAWAQSRDAWWPGRRPDRPVPAWRRRWDSGAWVGVGTGLATALAGAPALFVLYLALTRQWRPALTAAGTALVAALAAFTAAPAETLAWAGRVLFHPDRGGPVGAPANQSLGGVLARLYDAERVPVLLWLAFAVLLVAVGMIRARQAHADGDEIAAFTLVGLAAAAIGPVTPTHELVWVLPAVLILLDTAGRRRAAVHTPRRRLPVRRSVGAGYAVAAVACYLLFVLAPVWTMRDAFGANVAVLALIVLVSALPWRQGVAPAFPVNRWLRPGRSRRRPAA